MPEREIKTIEECYKDAPHHLLEGLKEFRQEFRIQQFEYKGKTVEYIATGKGDKTLLMFHGALGSADTPYTEILRLKDRYRIITPTIRDLGSLDDISDSINEILRREHVERLYVRGGSFGAFIAQSFFRRNYLKIDKMVLINGTPPKGEYTKKDHRYVRLFKFLFKLISEKRAKKIMLKELGKLGGHSSELSPEQQAEQDFLFMQVNERLAKVRKRHIVESMMLVVEFDLNETMISADFKYWKGEILLITDNEDASFKNFETLKAQYPDPKVKIFEKSGHLLQIVYKDEFEKILDDFLDGIE